MVILPKQCVLDSMEEVLTKALKIYTTIEQYEGPDPDQLLLALRNSSQNTIFEWNMSCSDQGTKFVSPYILSGATMDNGTIVINLMDEHVEDHWNPDEFKKYILHFTAHEAIHLAQRDLMGHDTYINYKSGYIKALEYLKDNPGDNVGMMRIYLSDTNELMAHGHDLADEISYGDKPHVVLEDVELYTNYLPTYRKYRQYFEPNSLEINQLVTNAREYFQITNGKLHRNK